MLQGAVFI